MDSVGGRDKKNKTSSKKNNSKAKKTNGTSRLVLNKSNMTTSGSIFGTCLPDTICNLIYDNDKKKVHSSLLSSMPSKRETTIGATIGAMRGPLAAHEMKLESASARFHNHEKGGLSAYCLTQEKECSLVLAIKVSDLEKDNTRNNFVTWDGKVIYNSPHNYKVNLKSDRTKE